MRASPLLRPAAPVVGAVVGALAISLAVRVIPAQASTLADQTNGFDTLLGAAAWLLASAVLTWALLAVALAALATAPGLVGQAARRTSERITPSLARRALATALGVAGVAAPVTPAWAASGGAGSDHPDRAAAVATFVAALDRPALDTFAPPVPLLDRPAVPATAGASHAQAPTVTSGPAEPAAQRDVIVRPGDTLWSIAARHLGAAATPSAIATAWPRWYAANRAVIGADPGLLHPGQRLRVPGDAGISEAAPAPRPQPPGT